jgi:hypothetical protein
VREKMRGEKRESGMGKSDTCHCMGGLEERIMLSSPNQLFADIWQVEILFIFLKLTTLKNHNRTPLI